MVDWNPFSEESWGDDEQEQAGGLFGFDEKADEKPKGEGAKAKRRRAQLLSPLQSASMAEPRIEAGKTSAKAETRAAPAREALGRPLHGFGGGIPKAPELAGELSPEEEGAALLAAQEAPPPLKPGQKRALIIDDNFMVRRNHKAMLEHFGFSVVEAVDGQSALEKMERYGVSSIHLAIVDLNMPVMNGDEFVSEAKGRFGESMPPVLICTVTSDAPVVKSMAAKGIAGYLLKPIDHGHFVSKLKMLFPDLRLPGGSGSAA